MNQDKIDAAVKWLAKTLLERNYKWDESTELLRGFYRGEAEAILFNTEHKLALIDTWREEETNFLPNPMSGTDGRPMVLHIIIPLKKKEVSDDSQMVT